MLPLTSSVEMLSVYRMLQMAVPGNLRQAPDQNHCLRSCRHISLPFLILIPISQHIANAWAVRQLVNILKILLRDLKWPSSHIGDVFPDQLRWIDGRAVDLLQ